MNLHLKFDLNQGLRQIKQTSFYLLNNIEIPFIYISYYYYS